MDLDGRTRLGDDRVGLALDPPLVDGRHRAKSIRICAHAGGLVLDVLREGGIDMEQRPVDAGVVHVGDEVAGRIFERVRRQEDLGEVVAVDGPDEPLAVAVDSKVTIGGQPDGSVRRSLEQHRGVARGPSRTRNAGWWCPGVAPLPERHVVLDGRVTRRVSGALKQ